MENKDISRITQELKMAYNAQAEGNLGLARVCARRAAGWAIQAYLLTENVDLASSNALEHIKYLHQKGNNSPQMEVVLEHLQIKVVKDSLEEDAYYPLEGVNLVEEAHWLVEQMLGKEIDLQ
jgi:hypothetical protein